MKHIMNIVLFAVVFAGSVALHANVYAQTPTPGDDKVTLENPIGTTDIRVITGRIISTALGILGSITLIAIVYGGFLWLTSAGNQERIKKGTQTMMWAIAGVFLVFSGYAILNTIIAGIGATGQGVQIDSGQSPGTGAAPPAETSVCEGKTCWYKIGSSAVNQYQEPGTFFSPAKPKFSTAGACFVALEEVNHQVGNRKGVYIKVQYAGSDTWFRTNIGSTEYWKKVADPSKDCKSYPK
jgi:hypothetical protein